MSADQGGGKAGRMPAAATKAGPEREQILVVFKRNVSGNDFWERRGFTGRDDLVYRNKVLKGMVRM